MTAYNTSTETQQCLESGMNDFVMKPFDPELFYQKIIGMVQHEISSSEKQSGDSFQMTSHDQDEHYDLSYLNMMTGNNAELKDKIIQMLIDETPDELYNLKQFTREKNWKRVRAVSHKMKSGVTYLGLSKTLELVKRIEEYSESENHLDRVPDLVERVSVACSKAINDLARTNKDKHSRIPA